VCVLQTTIEQLKGNPVDLYSLGACTNIKMVRMFVYFLGCVVCVCVCVRACVRACVRVSACACGVRVCCHRYSEVEAAPIFFFLTKR
jgi:hypothetical protein